MKNLLIPIILFLFIRCEPVPTQSISNEKRIIFDDYVYESIIGASQLIPIENGAINELENPVLQLNQDQFLLLQLDLLTDEFEYLAAKIHHCNKDWTKSLLRDMEFLYGINHFRITDFDYSLNTNQPYINYRFQLPKPRISGNYILAVHRRGNPKDVLLTRKFLAVDNISVINQQVRTSTTVAKRGTNQQVDFDVDYGNIQINSPLEDISVFVLQNHRWRDAIGDIKPSLIRPNENYMEFRSLDPNYNFAGWNEFRFFDLRTLGATGRNLSKIEIQNGTIQAFLGLGASRGHQVHTQNLRDINGNFILRNNDIGDVHLNSDYADVHFCLEANQVPGKVYVTGRFNNWALSNENIMRYDAGGQVYRTSIYLKQGYYDYHYYLESNDKPPYHFEGSHFQTENDYEILVYYRKPGNVNDELIGYKKFNVFINN